MPPIVVMGAMLTCNQGAAPTALIVTPENKTIGVMRPIATVMDNIPIKNIVPFGTCKILTAAASGVPTPCVPATVAPWSPGSPTVLIGAVGFKALTSNSKLQCTIGGSISIIQPGQAQIMVP